MKTFKLTFIGAFLFGAVLFHSSPAQAGVQVWDLSHAFFNFSFHDWGGSQFSGTFTEYTNSDGDYTRAVLSGHIHYPGSPEERYWRVETTYLPIARAVPGDLNSWHAQYGHMDYDTLRNYMSAEDQSYFWGLDGTPFEGVVLQKNTVKGIGVGFRDDPTRGEIWMAEWINIAPEYNGIVRAEFNAWGSPGATPVPEPATMVLFGSGLLGGAFLRKKRRS